jgi:hypothetical protein
MLNSSSISLFSMSVLKKIQIADAPGAGWADPGIIGVVAVECQKPVRISHARLASPCFIVAR